MEKNNTSDNFRKVLQDKEPKLTPELASEEAVILVNGKNLFGDPVFSYIKFTLAEFRKMRQAMEAGENFKPSDYGQVLASGRGEPSAELKEEMRTKYGLVDKPKEDPTKKNQEVKTPSPDFSKAKPMEGLGKDLSVEAMKLGDAIKKLK